MSKGAFIVAAIAVIGVIGVIGLSSFRSERNDLYSASDLNAQAM
jgi:hypothetical protein